MGLKDTKTGKLLYHLTRLENIDSIFEHGLMSRKYITEQKIKFNDVANLDIISKRTELGLDDLIPFHFHPYSSFDVAVKNTFSNEEFIYICITREGAKHNEFKILPKHPLTIDECTLFEYDRGFNSIDWETMHRLGTDDDYTKHVKMAECLTGKRIPADCFHCIYVKSDESKILIKKKLINKGILKSPPYVDVQKWL